VRVRFLQCFSQKLSIPHQNATEIRDDQSLQMERKRAWVTDAVMQSNFDLWRPRMAGPVHCSLKSFLASTLPAEDSEDGWLVVRSIVDPRAAERELKINPCLVGCPHVVLIVECCPAAESLLDFVKRSPGNDLSVALGAWSFTEADIRRISFDILTAISEIHSRSCVHRDIKPETILLSRRGKAYLADFGRSTGFAWRFMSDPVGMPWYMAPELFREHVKYDYSVDMWAFGVLLFDMVSGRRR
jgi:serine/threonine protein kinase